MAILTESIGLIEATKGKNIVRIIEANKRGSSAYYPADVLERDAHLFKAGTQMFADHATEDENYARPEGSVKDLIGVLESDAVFQPDGLYAEMKIFEDKKAWLKERAPYIGLSIRASGRVRESDEGPILEAFESVHSVDVVTKAGAGGKFVSLAESARPGVLTEASPVEEPSHEKETVMEFPKELAEALDAQIKAVNALVEKLNAPAPEPVVVEESEVNPLDVAAALVESGLPKASQERVIAAVKGGAVLAEAVKAEQDYVKGIVEAAKPAPKKDDEGNFEANLEESNKDEAFKLGSIFG